MDAKYWDIAVKQLGGTANASEQEELQRWLSESPENVAAYQAQKDIWQLTAATQEADVNTDAAWQKIKSQLVQEQPAKVIPMYRSVWRVAASIVLLIGVLWLAKYYFLPYYGMEVVESGDRQIAIVLPDSSQVWLNKNSKLVYEKAFDGNERNVRLEGEAFFEVQHNPEKPFIILSSESQTKVLGTSFNLRAYPDESLVELSVATGKVAFKLREQKSEVIVTPGFAAKLNTSTKNIAKTSIAEENAWAWKTGKLQFRNSSLKDVMPVLERYYGVNLKLEQNALANCRFTGSFQQADLKEVLQVLEATMQIQSTKQNNQTYTITGQGCEK